MSLDLDLAQLRALRAAVRGRETGERAVAAIGHPDRAEPDRDVLRVAADGHPPARDHVLARVDARDGPVAGIDDPDLVGADRERYQNRPAGLDKALRDNPVDEDREGEQRDEAPVPVSVEHE